MGSNLCDKMPLDTDFHGKRVLNIGCGSSILTDPNAVNVDFYGNEKGVIKWDLNVTPYTFSDYEQFDLVIANHVLEHLYNWWSVFEECARLLKVGGILQVWVPGAGDSVFGHRDHVTEINACSFFGTYDNFMYDRNSWCAEFGRSPANQLKAVASDKVLHNRWWINYAPQSLKKWYADHLRNVVFELGFTFQKIPIEVVNARIASRARPTGRPPI